MAQRNCLTVRGEKNGAGFWFESLGGLGTFNGLEEHWRMKIRFGG